MPKVTVWECPHSYMLFRTEAEYKAHLKKLAQQRAAERRRKLLLKKREDKMDELYLCRSLTEIENWLKANWQFVADDKNATVPISISFESMSWSNTTSNSHSAPKGRIQNWGRRKPNAPSGYSGWGGRLFVTFGGNPTVFASSVLKNTNIRTGTGGGAASFRAEVKVWAEDFPHMVEQNSLYPYMVPQNAQGDIDLSDERIIEINYLMLSKALSFQPAPRVSAWLNQHCGERIRVCGGVPDTWHFFIEDDNAYVFLNTIENKEKFENHFLAYDNNWQLLKTLPQINEASRYFRDSDKEKLGQRSYSYGCSSLDDIGFEPLGEIIKVDMYKLFTNRDDFTLFKIQADRVNEPVALTPW